MPRDKRKVSRTRIYHVIVKGADRQLLFEETKDYVKYLEILENYKDELNFKLFAYCLMSNHVHLLIQVSEEGTLEKIFRSINTKYAVWFNMKYNRTGFVQDGRYHSEPVETIEYFLTAIRYIHLNPQKAGLESAPGEQYPWSSFVEYCSDVPRLIDRDTVFQIIGDEDLFFSMHSYVTSDDACFDIKKTRKRLPDDVAKSIIEESCGCKNSTEFQKLSILERNCYIKKIYNEGVSIRQLNRLTGVPRGVIERVLKKRLPRT